MTLLTQGIAFPSRVVAATVDRLHNSSPAGSYGFNAGLAMSATRRSYNKLTFDEPTLNRDIGSRFGQRLRELRRQRNLTQLQMAKKFGIDRSFISDVERGRKSISLGLLEVIALGLRVSLSDLFRDI
jgi:DNA-binding XRE family transcriptional regulator